MDSDQPFEQPAANAAPSCPRCAAQVPLIYVHGHAQCTACGCNILDCCQGASCEAVPGEG